MVAIGFILMSLSSSVQAQSISASLNVTEGDPNEINFWVSWSNCGSGIDIKGDIDYYYVYNTVRYPSTGLYSITIYHTLQYGASGFFWPSSFWDSADQTCPANEEPPVHSGYAIHYRYKWYFTAFPSSYQVTDDSGWLTVWVP
jgi:hypothetical protein